MRESFGPDFTFNISTVYVLHHEYLKFTFNQTRHCATTSIRKTINNSKYIIYELHKWSAKMAVID